MANTASHILIIGPAWVGDMVIAQSLFKALKQRNPNAVIDVLAPAWSAPLVERMPEVDHSIVLPFRHGEWRFLDRYRMGQSLRSKNYDHAYVLPNAWKSALIPWAAKIPHRTGWLGEQRFLLLNDFRYLDRSRYPLMIERFVALADRPNAPLPHPLPKPRLSIKQGAVTAALIKHGMSVHKPIIALCPGAEFGASKRWPPEYFAELACKMLVEGWEVWLFGSPKDKELAYSIERKTQNRCQNLIGKTNLLEAIDLLSLVEVVITNDSGLMHIAAALEKPQIILYGSSSPAFTPPLSDKAMSLSLELVCSPCFKRECPLQHHRCLRDLLPSMVLESLVTHQMLRPSSVRNNILV